MVRGRSSRSPRQLVSMARAVCRELRRRPRGGRGSRRRGPAARGEARRAEGVEDRGGGGDRARQASGSRCWEPTWKLTPAGSRPTRCGEQQDLGGLADGAAELSRQRPVRPLAGGDEPAEDRSARCGLRDLVHLGQGVDDEHPDAEGGGLDDVVAALHRVGVDEASGAAPAAGPRGPRPGSRRRSCRRRPRRPPGRRDAGSP